MFQLKELIYKTNVLRIPLGIPALQYFPIACKKRFKNTDTSPEDTGNLTSNSKCTLEEDKSKRLVKHCLMMSYSGSKYRGMQYQKDQGVATIEEVLFKAMLQNKWITEEAYKQPYTIQFQGGSRTDKGVSAVRQCCSILLPTGLDIADINDTLPDDVRLFGLKRVTHKFNARYYCTARTYTYTLPTIAFCHYNDQSSQQEYRLSSEKLKFVNEILQNYKGNRNYHNFTVDKTYSDPASYRQILHVECEAPFLVDDVEFCVIRLRGRSFMMHQIRKMMGLMLGVVREVTDASIFDVAFTDKGINCPTAPGLGLVLDRLHFESYDQKYGNDKLYGKLTWEECEENVRQFYDKYIKSNIVQTELDKEQMLEWLETLLNYLYIPEVNSDDGFSESHKSYI